MRLLCAAHVVPESTALDVAFDDPQALDRTAVIGGDVLDRDACAGLPGCYGCWRLGVPIGWEVVVDALAAGNQRRLREARKAVLANAPRLGAHLVQLCARDPRRGDGGLQARGAPLLVPEAALLVSLEDPHAAIVGPPSTARTITGQLMGDLRIVLMAPGCTPTGVTVA